MKSISPRSGQTLLILILLATVLVTIGLSVARNTQQEAQLARVEEDAKKAFSAAEAGLEATLERGSTDVSDLSFEGISSLTTSYDEQQTASFTTPQILKDNQFSFYLASYNEDTKLIDSAQTYSGDFRISVNSPSGSYCTGETTSFAVELTFVDISTSPMTTFKRLIDPCSVIDGSTTHEWNFDTTYTLNSESIAGHIVFARILAPSASFPGAKLTITSPDPWPAQGRTIISKATTTTGVEKIIKLFQSNPQIPADFLVTSF